MAESGENERYVRLDKIAQQNALSELLRTIESGDPSIPTGVVVRGIEALMSLFEHDSPETVRNILRSSLVINPAVVGQFVEVTSLAPEDRASLAEQVRVNGELGLRVRELLDELDAAERKLELANQLVKVVKELMRVEST
ncbi:MAG: hypothetical protein WAT17_01710 [Candidatus Saccharimonadales bacterium]|jgi:hypothetical protein